MEIYIILFSFYIAYHTMSSICTTVETRSMLSVLISTTYTTYSRIVYFSDIHTRHTSSHCLHSFLLHVPNILGSMGCTHSCYMYQTFWDQWAAPIPVTCTKHSGINGLHPFLLHVPHIHISIVYITSCYMH